DLSARLPASLARSVGRRPKLEVVTRTFALVACAVLASAARADVRTVLGDEVVAVVDGRAVLLSEIEIEARLGRAVEEGAGTLEMPLSTADLKNALDAIIDRLVVYAQADRLQVFPP